ncbi:MAG: hypothetical protein NC822_04680 [Candidatus Omnitrophica bacterium]|nr:hypothetical protein [Candidatus Omnitrophota bacterium]MCM8827304.1 hypothetical protein [Candidatus Omnitrophota bacterium]
MMSFYNHKEIDELVNEIVRLMPSLEAIFTWEETLPQFSKRINYYCAALTHLERQKFFKNKIKIERFWESC